MAHLMEEQLKGIVEGQVLQTLEAVENEVDQKLHALEEMDDEDLERIRERRMAQMKKRVMQKREWLAKGHGRYREVTGQKEFFEEAKQSKRVVAHFYRPTTWRCEIMDKHLTALAPKHVETKFIKVNAEKSPFLVERLRIYMLPTVVIIKEGKTEHAIIGFDEFGGSDEFPTEIVEQVLVGHGAVFE